MTDYFDDDYDMFDYDDDPLTGRGCLFPGECLMFEPHMVSECYTVEMVQSDHAYYDHLQRLDDSRLYRIWDRLVSIPFAIHQQWHRKREQIKVWLESRYGWFAIDEDEIPF